MKEGAVYCGGDKHSIKLSKGSPLDDAKLLLKLLALLLLFLSATDYLTILQLFSMAKPTILQVPGKTSKI
jgi:hypothetical protein